MQKKKQIKGKNLWPSPLCQKCNEDISNQFYIFLYTPVKSNHKGGPSFVQSPHDKHYLEILQKYPIAYFFFLFFFYRNYTFFTFQMLRRKKFVFYPICTQIRKQMRKYLHTNKTILHEQQAENSRVYVHFYSLIPHRRQIYWSD